MGEWIWLIVGFLTSAITLHIATLLLLDEPSLIKAITVAASMWLLGTILVLFHVRGSLLYGLAGQILGCLVIKRLYGIGFAHALVVLLVHGVIGLAIGLLLWFMFPTVFERTHLLT